VGQYSVVNHRGDPVGGKYDSVGDPQDIDGRLAFKATRGDREFVVNEKGEIVAEEFDYVSVPQNIHGQIVFWARRGTEFFLVNEKGAQHGRLYDEIFCVSPLPGGQAYVIAQKDNHYVKEILDVPFQSAHGGAGVASVQGDP
jgi:hypothetical protein